MIDQAKKLKSRLDRYKKENDDLYKYKDEFDDKLSRETYKIRKREEEKREDISKQTYDLNKRVSLLEHENGVLVSRVENLRAANKEPVAHTHYLTLIDTLEKELTNSKSTIEELHRLNVELSSRLESNNKKLSESIDSLRNTEGEEHKSKEISILKSQIDELKKELKIEQSTNESLIKEIDVTGNAYEESLKKIKLLTQQINEQEQNYIQLMNERIKESGWKALHDKEKQELEKKILTQDELINQLKEVIKENEDLINRLEKVIESLTNELSRSEDHLREFERKNEDSINRHAEIVRTNEELKHEIEKGKQHNEKIAKTIQELQVKLLEADQRMAEQEERHKRETNVESLRSTDEILNADLERYRVIDI